MILSGVSLASSILLDIKKQIPSLPRPPGLAFLLIGDNPSSRTYVQMKKKRCSEVGITSIDVELPKNITEKEVLQQIHTFNQDPHVDGILVQLPLPPHLSTEKILEAVDPKKDIDGFHPLNIGKMLLGQEGGFLSCTPYGIWKLLTHYQVPIEGKHVVILGRSNIVGKPLASILLQKKKDCNATVTIAHSHSENLSSLTKSADILVAAMGSPHFVKPSMVKEGAVVVDVGISKVGGVIVGDVAYEKLLPIVSAITPVPGGVGPMTIAMLLSNTLSSYTKKITHT